MTEPLIFGDRDPNADYFPRPAAYGLYQNEEHHLALILEPFGYYLPGGGMDPGETPEAALRRECLEELGWEIEVGPYLAEAECWLYSPRYLKHHHNLATFFRIQHFREITQPIEEDHQLVWIPPEKAINLLEHPHQVWAVQRYAL